MDERIVSGRPRSIDKRLRDRIIISSAILALAVVVVLFLSTGGASLVLAPASGSSGATVRVTGSGFAPYSRGTLVWDGGTMLGEFQTTRDGTLAFSFVIPAATAGDHAVAATFPSAHGRLEPPSPAVATTVMFTVTGALAMSTPTATGSSPSAAIKPAASATPIPTKAPKPTATPKAAPSSAPVSTAAAVATPAAAAPRSPPPRVGSAALLTTICGGAISTGTTSSGLPIRIRRHLCRFRRRSTVRDATQRACIPAISSPMCRRPSTARTRQGRSRRTCVRQRAAA